MKYYVQCRFGERGPYTLDRLQREVASGDVLLSDMARGRDAEAWVPVGQVLAGVPMASSAVAIPLAQGAAYPGAQAYDIAENPVPPNLPWVVVLLLGMATASVFTAVWAVVQA